MNELCSLIDERLTSIEGLLQGLIKKEKPNTGVQNDYIHIANVVGQYYSRRSLYDYVNAGLFILYKLGGASVVKGDEVFGAFRRIEAAGNKKGGDI